MGNRILRKKGVPIMLTICALIASCIQLSHGVVPTGGSAATVEDSGPGATAPNSVPTLQSGNGVSPGDDAEAGSYPGIPPPSSSPPSSPIPSPSPPGNGTCDVLSKTAAELQLQVPASSFNGSQLVTDAVFENFNGRISTIVLPPASSQEPPCSSYWRPSSRLQPIPLTMVLQLSSSSPAPISLSSLQQLHSEAPDQLELYVIVLSGSYAEGVPAGMFRMELGFADTFFEPATGVLSGGVAGLVTWPCAADPSPAAAVRGLFTGKLSEDGTTIIGELYLVEVTEGPPADVASNSVNNVSSADTSSSGVDDSTLFQLQLNAAEQDMVMNVISQAKSGAVVPAESSASGLLELLVETSADPVRFELQGSVDRSQLSVSANLISAKLTVTTVQPIAALGVATNSSIDKALELVSAASLTSLQLSASELGLSHVGFYPSIMAMTSALDSSSSSEPTGKLLLCSTGVNGDVHFAPGQDGSIFTELFATVCMSPAVVLGDGTTHDLQDLASLGLTQEQLAAVKLVLQVEFLAQFGYAPLYPPSLWQAKQAACSPPLPSKPLEAPQMNISSGALLGGSLVGHLLLTSTWDSSPPSPPCPLNLLGTNAGKLMAVNSSTPIQHSMQYSAYSAKLTGKLTAVSLPPGTTSEVVPANETLKLLGGKEESFNGLLGGFYIELSHPGQGKLNISVRLGAPAMSIYPGQQSVIGPLSVRTFDLCGSTVHSWTGGSYVLSVLYDGSVNAELQWGSGFVISPAPSCQPDVDHQCAVLPASTEPSVRGYSSNAIGNDSAAPLVVGSARRVWQIEQADNPDASDQKAVSSEAGVYGEVKHWLVSESSGLVSAVLALNLLGADTVKTKGSWPTANDTESMAYPPAPPSEWLAAAAGDLTVGQLLDGIFRQQSATSDAATSWGQVDLSFTVRSGTDLQIDLKLTCTAESQPQNGTSLVIVGALLPAAASGPFYQKSNVRQCFTLGAVHASNITVAFEYPQLAELMLDPSEPSGNILLVRFVGKMMEVKKLNGSGGTPPSDPTDDTTQVDPCTACEECLGYWAGFAARRLTVQNVTALADEFTISCATAKSDATACSRVGGMIKGTGASGTFAKRAAGICRELGVCSAALLPLNCSLQGVSVAVGKLLTAGKPSDLDECTVEGLPGGTHLPETYPAESKIPAGSCQVTADCAAADLFCDNSKSSTFCTCAAGVDTCKYISACKPNPCALCNNCIQSLVTKFLPANLYTGREALAKNFNTSCLMLQGTSAEQCSMVSSQILNSLPDGNLGRRAGLLCNKLGVCPNSLLTSCRLVVNQPSTGANLNGSVDLCTVEGVTGGNRLDGISETDALMPGQCSADGDCGSADLHCDKAALTAQCTCASGVDNCKQLGKCAPTPCSKCRSCLALTTTLITTTTGKLTDPSRVALAIGDYCTSRNHPPTTCTAVQQLVANSWAGAVGKRAGALCVALGDCEPAVVTGTETAICNLATLGVVPPGTLDQCTVEGTSEGLPSPDPKSVAAPVGACFKGNCSHMGAPSDYVCDSSTVGQACSCSGGKDSCESYGYCQRTPCKVCKICLAEFRMFAVDQATNGNATAVAAAFATACAKSGRATGVCYEAQLAIAASIRGNLGKRPAAVCRMLAECAVNQLTAVSCTVPVPGSEDLVIPKVVPVSELDYCTVTGLASGDRVTNVSATGAPVEAGRCLESKDCGTNDKACVAASDGATQCECSNGVDICRPLGQCVLTDCGVCTRCLNRVRSFVEPGRDANVSTLVADFLIECKNWGKEEGVCSSVGAAIINSPNGVLGRRAGMLCNQLQECAPDLGCLINTTTATNKLVNLCTIEGIEGGTMLPVSPASLQVPKGKCQVSADCNSSDLMCSLTMDVTTACSCSNGVDKCVQLGACVPTPCKVCNNCLQHWQVFVNGTALVDNATAAAAAFRASCLQSNRSEALCSAVAAAAAERYMGNFVKRAGSICSELQECDPLALGPSCLLSGKATTDSRPLQAAASNMSFCTLEGLPGGTIVPGITPQGALPTGACSSDPDCRSKDLLCSTTTTTTMWNCFSGEDVSVKAPVCRPTPCKICRDCLQEQQPVVISLQGISEAAAVAAIFASRCSLMKQYSAEQCSKAQAQIAASRNGNLGKRASGVCTALGLCAPPSAVAPDNCGVLQLTNSTGGILQGVRSQCTVEGVEGGSTVFGVAPSAAIPTDKCASDSDCAKAEGEFCDITAEHSQLCTCTMGIDVCTALGSCRPGPCKLCRTCLGSLASWAAATTANMTSPLQASLAFSTMCRTSGRSSTRCSQVQATLSAQRNANMAKRAGALCVALKECDYATLAGCSLASQANATQKVGVPEGQLSECTAEGTTAGNNVAGVFAKPLVLPAGRCWQGAVCSESANFICSTAKADQVCTCEKGVESCQVQGYCVRTPCKVCNDCLVSMRAFSTQAAGESNVTKVAADFGTFCNSERAARACERVQLQIASSYRGNFAKRPAAVCGALDECPSNLLNCTLAGPSQSSPPVSVSSLDSCTTDGLAGGPIVSGISETAVPPNGSCRSSAECNAQLRERCSFSGTSPLCTCNKAVDDCTPLGTCLLTSCGECMTCMAGVQQFALNALNSKAPPAELALNFTSLCTGSLKKNATLCNEVASSIIGSYNGNTARRAAMLCSQLKLCTGDLGDTCPINATVAGTSVTKDIDLCTVEGVQGGTLVPGIVTSTSPPAGKCRSSSDCSDNFMCSLATDPVNLCTCNNGLDTCARLGSCVPTPCKQCNSCLQEMRAFAVSARYQTSSSAVAEAFRSYCTAIKRPQALCNVAAAAIAASQNGNFGKRVAGLCEVLQECDKASLGPTCTLTNEVAGGDALLSSAVLDRCTLEGLPGGSSLPGISATGDLPNGTCDSGADCKLAGYVCSKKDMRPLCSCYEGTDSCRQIGGCVVTPCKACNDCLKGMQSFVLAQQNSSSPSASAAAFYKACSEIGQSVPVCEDARDAIANSFGGNLAKRAGGLCSRLGSCSTQLPDTCFVTDGATELPLLGRLDQCTAQGVSGGTPVPGISTSATLPTGSCRWTSDCAAATLTCSMDAAVTQRFCTCSAGKDNCEVLGRCLETPCKRCSDCVSQLQPFTSSQSASATAADIGEAFYTACTSYPLNRPAATCANVRAFISFSKRGNLGRRAGALCGMLDACGAAVRLDCSITAGGVTGTFDACTAEGVRGGSASLPVVRTAEGMPAGLCLVSKDCNDPDSQCNLANTTEVCRCNQGTDQCQNLGSCRKNPPPVILSPCERCSNCLANVTTKLQPLIVAASTRSSYSTVASNWCSNEGIYDLGGCKDLAEAVARSLNGSLALRAGAVCQRMRECLPENLAAQNTSSCNGLVKVANVEGTLDLCTLEGVAGGTPVAGIFNGNGLGPAGACLRNADCVKDVTECRSSQPVTVCKCFNGMDSCDRLGTCQPIPPPPPPSPPPPSPCELCKRCLNFMQPLVRENHILKDEFVVASRVFDRCTSYNRSQLACSQLRTDISYSRGGNLGKRAAMICRHIGDCAPQLLPGGPAAATCSHTVASVGGASNITGVVDLCSVEGVVGATAVSGTSTASDSEEGTCRDDRDCASGQLCDKSSVKEQCTCKAGVDNCQTVGSCVDVCAAPKTRAELAKASIAVPCDPFLPNQCSGTLVCQATAKCTTLQCEPGKGLVTQACKGLCLIGERLLDTARLSDTGREVLVTLNAGARSGSFVCAAILENSNSLLGLFAWCKVEERQLTMELKSGGNLEPGTRISLKPKQGQLVDKLQSGATFGGSVVVDNCLACTSPVAKIKGPQSVSEPCDASTAVPTIFEAGISEDPTGRRLTKFVWSQIGVANPTLQAIIDSTNVATDISARSRITIPPSSLAEIPEGSYGISVTVYNWLKLSATASMTFMKLGPGETPSIGFTSGQQQSFKMNEQLKVETKLEAKSVCKGKKVEYLWESLDGWDAIPKNYTSNHLVLLAPIPAEPGVTYRVQLTAKFSGATKAATKIVELLATGSPLEASLKWAGGEIVKANQTIVLDATGSKDPDDPRGKQPLTFLWECVREDFPIPCFSTLNRGVQRAGKWTFSSSLLDPDIEHSFRVSVVKGDRSASVTNPVKITAKAAQVPTGRIARLCSSGGDGQACPTRHNADTPLSLALYLDPSSSAATYSWSSDQVPSISGKTGTSLAIPAEDLPKAGVLVVSVQLLLEGIEGKTSLSIPINAPPRCLPAAEEEGCLKVEVKSANYPKAVFEATAAGLVDDDQLSYEFGVLAEGRRQTASLGALNTFTFTGLALGPSVLYVCASDTGGAEVCETATVTVEPPSSCFKRMDGLGDVDVTQMAATGDPSVLAAGAKSFTSLVSYDAENVQQGLDCPQSTEEEKQAENQALTAKTRELLDGLAAAGGSLVADPQAVKQILAATSGICSNNGSAAADEDTRAKLRVVADSALAAAQLSGKGMDGSFASNLLGVLSAGSDFTGQSSSGNAPGRRLLGEGDSSICASYPATNAQTTMAVLATSLSATPATGPISVGDGGLYLTIANLLGSSYPATAIAAGSEVKPTGGSGNPMRAVEDSAANVLLRFNGALAGPCASSGTDGETTTGGEGGSRRRSLLQSSSNTTCSDSVVAVQLFYYEKSASGFLATSSSSSRRLQAAEGAEGAVASGDMQLVSGAVEFTAGQEVELPCSAGSGRCTATLSIPISGYQPQEGWKLECIKLACGQAVSGAEESDGFYIAGNGSASSAECIVKEAGVYALAAIRSTSPDSSPPPSLSNDTSPNPTPSPSPSPKPQEATPEASGTEGDVTLVMVTLTFPIAFTNLMSNATAVAKFKAGIVASVAAAAKVVEEWVIVKALRPGSVVADVEISLPIKSYSSAQAAAVASAIVTFPDKVFDQLKRDFGVTGSISARAWVPVDGTVTGQEQSVSLGVGIGLGVGGALVLVAALAVYTIQKKRKAATAAMPQDGDGQASLGTSLTVEPTPGEAEGPTGATSGPGAPGGKASTGKARGKKATRPARQDPQLLSEGTQT